MLLLISGLLLCCSLSSSQLSPYGSTPLPLNRPPTPSPFPPTAIPNAFPFGPTPRPLVPGLPGYNDPYYDPRTGPAVPILTYSSDHVGDGSYSFSFSTADGKQVQENGHLKDAYIDNAGEPQGTQVVQGSYAYISPDGTPIQVNYVADENGFRPSGVRIPADGKALPPFVPLIDDKKGNKIFDRYDPYNRYDPHNPYNRYDPNNRYDPHSPYNRYDPNYRYDPNNRYDLNNRNDPNNRFDPNNRYDPHNPYNRYDPNIRYDPNNRYDPNYRYDPNNRYDLNNRNDPNNRYDPYNRYDPFNRNYLNRPYDQRYPFNNPRPSPFNSYRPLGSTKDTKVEPKNESAQ